MEKDAKLKRRKLSAEFKAEISVRRQALFELEILNPSADEEPLGVPADTQSVTWA